MNTRYSIRREAEGLSLPFGASAVAAICALIGGLAGLLVPRAMLETVAFQLYLDTIIPSAKAPLGASAQLVAAVVLAMGGALAGYLIAWVFDVRTSPGGFAGLLARLRGELAEDEADAPPLRSADRHPDAPARRPFSAARDIPSDVGVTIDAVARPRLADDEDELLLNLPVAEAPDEPVAIPVYVAESGANDAAIFPAAITPAAINADDATGVIHAMDGFDLSPPTLDDWETGSFGDEPEPAVEPVAEPEPLTPTESDPEPMMVYAPPQPRAAPLPLDLSAARLDELIARLEAGLTRKVAVAPPPAKDMGFDQAGETLVAERPAPPSTPEPEPEPDPAFPHDPALAAALATLRKMNLRTQ